MNYTFFTGLGRSGTVFTSGVLSHLKDSTVKHEWIGNKEFSLLNRYLPDDVYAETYLERVKERIETEFHTANFIDVNPWLKNAVPALRKVFPGCSTYVLVRHPKEVIRSLYARRSPKTIHEIPTQKEEVERWLDGDKFYRICWNWADYNRTLLKQGARLVRFEDLKSDYNYFDEQVLTPLGFEMSREDWSEGLAGRRNKTHSKLYRYMYSRLKGKEYIAEYLPEYDQWSSDQKKTMKEICGEVAAQCGYDI